jgi:hypothetical protein
MDKPALRPIFFGFDKEYAEFQLSFSRALQGLNRKLVRDRISEENTQRFNHGRSWVHAANSNVSGGEFRSMSAEMDIKFEDVIANNLDIIPNSFLKIVEAFKRQFMEALYSTVSEACDRSGNTVSAKAAGSFAAGFMEAMKKIEFGVDREGNVSLPEIHAGDPQKLIAEIEAQPAEYHAEFERLKSEKIAAALDREKQRKERFKRRDTCTVF